MNRDDIAELIQLVESRRLPDEPDQRAKLVRGDQRLLEAIVARDARLTERERQVVSLVGDGLSDKAAADRLGLSVHTVKQYLKQARLKLGLSGLDQRRKGLAA